MAKEVPLLCSAVRQMAERQYLAMRAVVDAGYPVENLARWAGCSKSRFYTYVPKPEPCGSVPAFEPIPAAEWLLLDAELMRQGNYLLHEIGMPRGVMIVEPVEEGETNGTLADEAEDLHTAAVTMRQAELGDNPDAILHAAQAAELAARRARREAQRKRAEQRVGRGQVEGIILAVGGDGR